MKDNFKFYIPSVNLKKGEKDSDTGLQEMILEGMAGDGSKDSDGENMSYNSFDLTRMFYINWEHSKEPDDVIGVIQKKELQKGGKLFIKGKLFSNHAKAKSAYQLQEHLEKEGYNLGFSVEGKVIERDPINKNIVIKAELYGVALCKVPVNPLTYARISKAFSGEEDLEEEEEEEEVEKMTTADLAPTMPESVEKKKKKSIKNEILTKSQIYSKIFNNLTTDSVLADSIYNDLIKPISEMNTEKGTTKEVLEKAIQILGLATEKSATTEEDLSKGKKPDFLKKQDDKEDMEKSSKMADMKKAKSSAKTEYMEKAKAYSDMCKAEGVDEEDEEEPMEKSVRIFDLGAGNIDLIKSALTEVIGTQLQVLEKIEKSIEVRTTALGTLINSDREQISSLSEALVKANTNIETINEFNQDLRTRLGVVENTPLRKAVTTQNAVDRNFGGDPKTQSQNADVFNINVKADRDRLEKSVNDNFGDMSNPEHVKVMEAVATLQMTQTVENHQQALLKSKGFELVRM